MEVAVLPKEKMKLSLKNIVIPMYSFFGKKSVECIFILNSFLYTAVP